MIDHMGLTVTSCERSRAFYTQALAALGYEPVVSHENLAAFGPPGMPLFWIHEGAYPHTGVHVAFAANDRGSVDRFYEAALAAGGKDNGAPGLRLDYHEHYYGAFVFDPDGNNTEAVCHRPA